MPEEMRFMLRSAFYSSFVGIAYWLLTREPAGTVLLIGCGLAATVMFGALVYEWRQSGHRLTGPPWRWALLPPSSYESETTDQSGRLPRPTFAPITAALGVVLIALGLVFGIWMALFGVIPLLVGLRLWIRDVNAEWRAVDSSD